MTEVKSVRIFSCEVCGRQLTASVNNENKMYEIRQGTELIQAFSPGSGLHWSERLGEIAKNIVISESLRI